MDIFYHQYDSRTTDTHALSLEGVGYPPESLVSLQEEQTSWTKCPAWRHKASRTFVIRSPLDITIQLDPLQSNLTDQRFHRFVDEIIGKTIQLSIPEFLFWTHKKNVWIEQRPHPLTSLNNYVCVGGWFSLSAWCRPLGVGIEVIDPSKPVTIKRGDPLYEVCFYPPNLDTKIRLVKDYPSDKITREIGARVGIKKYANHFVDHLLFRKQESSCPFALGRRKKHTGRDK